MSLLELDNANLDKIKDVEFTVLLFYANGCAHCEAAKPIFETFSTEFPKIQFLKANFLSLREHYESFAEEEQARIYNENGSYTLQYNEDTSPKIVKSYKFPSFYVYHTKAQTLENPFGFIGGFDGNSKEEVKVIVEQLDLISNV